MNKEEPSIDQVKEEKDERVDSASEASVDDDWIGDYETDSETDALEEPESVDEISSKNEEHTIFDPASIGVHLDGNLLSALPCNSFMGKNLSFNFLKLF